MTKKLDKELEKTLVPEEEQLYEIPQNWIWVRIADINFKGIQKKPGEDFSYIDISSIDNQIYEIVNPKILSPEEAPSRARKVVQEGCIVYSTVRPYLKNMAIVPRLKNPIASTGFCILNTQNKILNKYLFKYLQTDAFTQSMIKKQSGANYPAVRDKDILQELIPLPPLAEQERIIEKLDLSFSFIDEIEKKLKKAKELLIKHHESLLQKAFKGELVERCELEGTAGDLIKQIEEEKNKGLKKKIKIEPIPEDEQPYEVPGNWVWVKLDDICYKIGDVDHRMPKAIEGEGYPYISAKDFINGAIDFNKSKKISEDDFRALSKKIKPELNDIIIARYGTIGESVLVKTDIDFLASYACAIIKPHYNHINSLYLYYYTKTNLIGSQIKKHINASTQPNVGVKSIKQFVFPLPPVSEQKCIAQRLEDEFTKEREVLKAIDLAESHLVKMRKSLLQKAFRGDLVEQRIEEGTALEILKEIIEKKLVLT